MKRNGPTAAVAFLGISLAACGGESPTSPESFSLVTELHIEPNVPAPELDPTGLVSITVLPGETGGTVTIEVCSDDAGQPMPGNYPISLQACADAGGEWAIARDVQGRAWDSRELARSDIVKFARETGQPPLLFRAAYEARAGGFSENVGFCPWLLAEQVDVGVLCTSEDDVRLLPVVR